MIGESLTSNKSKIIIKPKPKVLLNQTQQIKIIMQQNQSAAQGNPQVTQQIKIPNPQDANQNHSQQQVIRQSQTVYIDVSSSNVSSQGSQNNTRKSFYI